MKRQGNKRKTTIKWTPKLRELGQLYKPLVPPSNKFNKLSLLTKFKFKFTYYPTRTIHYSIHFIFFIKKGMSWSAGDWICNVCQNVNFKKREACHRCGYPKYGGPDPSTYSYNKTEALAGDWYCTTVSCGAHNYASRPNCFRCGAFKSVYPGDYGAYMMGSDQYGSDASIPPGWKSGDWICPRMGCGVHNYASRMECFKCKTPRDFGGAV